MKASVGAGHVNSVMLGWPAARGRLRGKYCNAAPFLDRFLDRNGEADACAYLLATDPEMRTVDGIDLASWSTGFQDCRLRPDLDTLRLAPWVPGSALVLADPVGADGTPVRVSPRHVLRHQIYRLASLGITAWIGLESEFVLFHEGDPHGEDAGHVPRLMVEANLDYSLDANPRTELLRAIGADLRGAGLPLEALKCESGHGQVEVTFAPQPPMESADTHVLLKHAATSVADRNGAGATFMASPVTGVGSGLHIHLSLWREGEPMLPGPDGDALSDEGLRVVGGLAELFGDLAPLYAPTVNSYKRWRPRSFAPVNMAWGYDNRTCSIRVVGHDEGVHLELRAPGADADPYLAVAAALAAVHHGLTRKPGTPSPRRGNAYEDTTAPPLPHTLETAVERFYGENVRGALGDDVVEHYAQHALHELAAMHYEVTDIERQRGLFPS
ncbi:glutamine synthetase family protein [Streptomyces sp. NBC_01795]|uniref:glutamine synthetase family protein n=1 Tax=unclassified Streptomyces TaxID=2593676 RepID=UPI002DDC3B92|nr:MULTISPECIES: glutamine synthetase family protein [unclassified Streptomyces]WSA91647.1 glutamine synthetase family protein [Streptomyces sp. NBC_01795]WSS15707.1 glutamine synthetase family protein [Streptomyces sp. NBC_01186]